MFSFCTTGRLRVPAMILSCASVAAVRRFSAARADTLHCRCGHLKNTVAIALGRQVFLSQHIGDLDAVESRQAFERAIEDLCQLYRFEPKLVACDLHPDYASTQ